VLVPVLGLLGRGSTATVYEVKLPDGKYAIAKVFTDECLANNMHISERENLIGLVGLTNRIKLIGCCVPKYLATSENLRTLFLEPVGQPFAFTHDDYINKKHCLLSYDHIHRLIDLLQIVHEQYVHRDIALDNIFQTKDGLLLNDWGCVCKKGEIIHFSGKMPLAAEEVITCTLAKKPFAQRPAHDLEMLVHTVYTKLFFSEVYDILRLDINDTSLKKINQFWSDQFHAKKLWAKMQKFAREEDYAKLKVAMRTVI